jgi:LacI family transcriptional regulator
MVPAGKPMNDQTKNRFEKPVPTLREVAQLASVSVATASNALNSPGRVSDELRQRVERAVGQLGYIPHAAAQSLRRSRGKLVALMVPNLHNPFFADLVEAVERLVFERGYSLLLYSSGEDVEAEIRHLNLLRSYRIDGLILAPAGRREPSHSATLAALKAPVVLVDRTLDGFGFDSVMLDNQMAGHLAGAHLVGLGHKRIGVILGSSSVSAGRERLLGFKEALVTGGVVFDQALMREVGLRDSRAYDAAIELLRRPDRPTAIFAGHSLVLLGVMRALAELGLRCPADVSALAVDDFPWAAAMRPRLTIVAQPVAEMAAASVALLFDRIDGAPPGSERRSLLAPRLIVRDSCAKPPEGA